MKEDVFRSVNPRKLERVLEGTNVVGGPQAMPVVRPSLISHIEHREVSLALLEVNLSEAVRVAAGHIAHIESAHRQEGQTDQ